VVFNNSVLKTTGQLWKGLVFVLVALGGVVLLVSGIANMQNPESAAIGFQLTMAGLITTLLGLVFVCTAIYCPKCRSRWVWHAIKEQDAGKWISWLLTRSKCPACGNNL
jgi:hypothetical protein